MRRTALACALLAAAFGAGYLAFAPQGADLPAAVFRADLFSRYGFTVVDNAWYGSHNLPAYSVIAPPLGAWLGVRLSAALAVVAAAALFPPLLAATLPRRTTWPASILFALTVSATLYTDRVAFLIGLPLGLGALLAAVRGWRAAAIGLALLTPLASPVAGAFLALVGASWWVATRRRFGVVLGVAGLVPVAVINLLFPEGGTFPMAGWVLWPSLFGLLCVALAAGPRFGVLRVGCALYAAALVFCFLIPNAAGANVARLIALVAPALLALELWERPVARWTLLVLVPVTLGWAAAPSWNAIKDTRGDPTTSAAYFAPLTAQLERIQAREGPIRVEIPFTKLHWEAARVAEHVPIARGWLRQLDRGRNKLFYEGTLTPRRYLAWLRDNGIRYVALPDAPLDFSATREAALIEAGLPGLTEVWHDAHWRLFRVADVRPLGVTDVGPDWFDVRATHAGELIHTRMRFSPHWAVVSGSGCVAGDLGFTKVRAARAGTLRIGVRVAPLRAALGQGAERCHDTGS